jgi:hypothetical protein
MRPLEFQTLNQRNRSCPWCFVQPLTSKWQHSEMECREDVIEEYDQSIQNAHEEMVWTHPRINNSWYQDSAGKTTVSSPRRSLDYWRWTKASNRADFRIT